MTKRVDGYRFKLVWSATSMTVRVNARDYDHAERLIQRWIKKGAVARFLCTCEPWPPEPKNDLPRKVF